MLAYHISHGYNYVLVASCMAMALICLCVGFMVLLGKADRANAKCANCDGTGYFTVRDGMGRDTGGRWHCTCQQAYKTPTCY